jgi:hypothetical protein
MPRPSKHLQPISNVTVVHRFTAHLAHKRGYASFFVDARRVTRTPNIDETTTIGRRGGDGVVGSSLTDSPVETAIVLSQ